MRTVRALELVTNGPISAQELADALLVDVRTARQLLNRLADDGVLVRRTRPRLRFEVGPKLIELAEAVAAARAVSH